MSERSNVRTRKDSTPQQSEHVSAGTGTPGLLAVASTFEELRMKTYMLLIAHMTCFARCAGTGITACAERDGICIANASYFLQRGALLQLNSAVAETNSCLDASDDARGEACQGAMHHSASLGRCRAWDRAVSARASRVAYRKVGGTMHQHLPERPGTLRVPCRTSHSPDHSFLHILGRCACLRLRLGPPRPYVLSLLTPPPHAQRRLRSFA